MSYHAYTSYEEPRTASRNANPIQSVQSWKSNSFKIAKAGIETSLEEAARTKEVSFKHALSYAPTKIGNEISSYDRGEAFHLKDLVSAVNPLHHIPIVGMVYRNMTGADLHPLSGIIGGAIYGGPVGAASGAVNAVSTIQTGKDLGQHALDIVL